MNNESTPSDELSRFVKVFDDVLTADQCDRVVKYFDEHEEQDAERGTIWTPDGEKVDESIKRVMQMQVPQDTELDSMIAASCGSLLNRYAESVEFYPIHGVTDGGYVIKKYYPNEDFYNWHTDDNNPEIANRVVAMLWYLNDVEEGGETELRYGCKVVPKKGSALIFPSSFCYPHRGNMPVSGSKYIVNTFIYSSPLGE